MLRQLRSLLLPTGVALVIPFFLAVRVKPLSLRSTAALPYLQVPAGLLVFGLGVSLLVAAIRLIIAVGKGTLAPWDPTRKLVVRGIYRHTRNPMISGVALMLLGESIALGSLVLFGYFILAVLINTVYFKLSEEPGLVKRFGEEYIRYRKAVPMWFPRLKPWDPESR